MSSPETRFCLSRAEDAHFEHMHGFMEYSDDIEIFELASPATHHSIDV